MFCDQADVADIVTSMQPGDLGTNHGQASNIASNTTGGAAQGFPPTFRANRNWEKYVKVK